MGAWLASYEEMFEHVLQLNDVMNDSQELLILQSVLQLQSEFICN